MKHVSPTTNETLIDKLKDIKNNLWKSVETIFKETNHNTTILLGSLSIFGYLEKHQQQYQNIPDILKLVHSPDFDLMLANDKERTMSTEFTLNYGENSPFEEQNGYHIDILSYGVVNLPKGWEKRTFNLNNNQYRIKCIDPQDAAVSKILRSANNDITWLSIGLKHGILNPDEIYNRLHQLEKPEIEDVNKAIDKLQNLLEELNLPPLKAIFDWQNGETVEINKFPFEYDLFIQYQQTQDLSITETQEIEEQYNLIPPFYKLEIRDLNNDEKTIFTTYIKTFQDVNVFINQLNNHDELINEIVDEYKQLKYKNSYTPTM